ncbi:MAG: methyltransferase domain-containing protein [Planctomycetaceae bacterium]|nr:methyltransferase domain-containing protein [Planctomycetaceae bacterium]
MATLTGLTARQLETIERSFKLGGQATLLDVGCGDGAWVGKLRARGVDAVGVDDPASEAPQADGILKQMIAANLSVPVHTRDVALIRGAMVFEDSRNTPETTIALANILATLKPGGSLLCAVPDEATAIEFWQQRLAPFRLTGAIKTWGTGIQAWLSLAPLLRPGGAVSLLEFPLAMQPLSKLEWHRLAREAVMPTRSTPHAA